MARRNLCPNPALGVDLSAGSGILPWSTNGATLNRVDVSATPEFQRPWAAQTDSSATILRSATGPVTTGATYMGSFYVRAATTQTAQVFLSWFNSAGTFLSNSPAGSVSLTAGVVSRASVSHTAPANAVNARVAVVLASAAQITMTSALIEPGSTLNSYADGETSGWRWDGTRYSSTSSEVHAITPSGIPSAETLGSPAVTPGAVTVSPTPIPSGEQFGAATVTPGAVALAPSGIISAEAVGTPTLTPGAVAVTPSGIPSGEAVPAPTVDPGPVTVAPAGVVSGELFGVPSLGVGPVTVAPVGVGSGEQFGTPVISGGEIVPWPPKAGTPTARGPAGVGGPTESSVARAGPPKAPSAVARTP